MTHTVLTEEAEAEQALIELSSLDEPVSPSPPMVWYPTPTERCPTPTSPPKLKRHRCTQQEFGENANQRLREALLRPDTIYAHPAEKTAIAKEVMREMTEFAESNTPQKLALYATLICSLHEVYLHPDAVI